MYLVLNIGCIECGVPSNIVGLFADKERADSIVDMCYEKHSWLHGGQNNYEVFELPTPEHVDATYEGVA